MFSTAKAAPKHSLVVCQGNSITNGSAVFPNSYPRQLQPLLDPYGIHTCTQLGHDGYKISQLVALGTELPASLLLATSLVAVPWEATNSIWFNEYTTLDTLWAAQVTWSNIWRAVGAKIIVPNIIARINFTTANETLALAYNARLASSRLSEVADTTADMRAIFPDYSDETKYADGIHPTQYGYGLIAAGLVSPIRALLGT